MGASASRMDRFYGNYEKSFERIEKDVVRLKALVAARTARRASIRWWASALLVLALAVAVSVIYQVQQAAPGALTYQQHFRRVGGALALPVAAGLLGWAAGLATDLLARRDTARLARLEAAKRAMLKDLKDMSRFERIKGLIDRFDPDARPPPTLAPAAGAMMRAGGGRGGMMQGQARHNQHQQQHQQQQVPALLVKGSGQVAGAAALAVAGAGRALMPLVDKLATSLISDNPVLLEDLRRAQQQLQDAEVRSLGTVQEVVAVKSENLELKQRLLELEAQLSLPPSFDADSLAEARQQLAVQSTQAQQAAWQVAAQQQAFGTGQQQPQDLQQLQSPPARCSVARAGEAGGGGHGNGYKEATAADGASPRGSSSSSDGVVGPGGEKAHS